MVVGEFTIYDLRFAICGLRVCLTQSRRGELTCPSLYVSAYLEQHRDLYYEALSKVRTDGDLLGWILFFLEAVERTSAIGCEKFRKIFDLRDEMVHIASLTSSPKLAGRAFRHLYSVPRVTVKQLAEALECNYQLASRLVKTLVSKDVLVSSSDSRRNQIYDFRRYLEIFKD